MNHVTVDRLRLILAILFAGLAVWQPSRDCTATEAEDSRTPGANLNALIRIGAAVDEDGWTVFKREIRTGIIDRHATRQYYDNRAERLAPFAGGTLDDRST